jgi:hypothetical protein
VGEVELSFDEYSASKRVHLHLDIVEYSKGRPPPLYNLIIGKQTLQDIGAVLEFKERTITIDDILLPMRNINNLQLKPSISRALNSLTAIGPYMAHRLVLASFKANNFLNFCPLTTFDSSKCSRALQLK